MPIEASLSLLSNYLGGGLCGLRPSLSTLLTFKGSSYRSEDDYLSNYLPPISPAPPATSADSSLLIKTFTICAKLLSNCVYNLIKRSPCNLITASRALTFTSIYILWYFNSYFNTSFSIRLFIRRVLE